MPYNLISQEEFNYAARYKDSREGKGREGEGERKGREGKGKEGDGRDTTNALPRMGNDRVEN